MLDAGGRMRRPYAFWTAGGGCLHTCGQSVGLLDRFDPRVERPGILVAASDTSKEITRWRCTIAVWRGYHPARLDLFRTRRLYPRPHLPPGARARSAGATYTGYADDLAFSGDEEFAKWSDDSARMSPLFLLKEGFRVNPSKTRVMRRACAAASGG